MVLIELIFSFAPFRSVFNQYDQCFKGETESPCTAELCRHTLFIPRIPMIPKIPEEKDSPTRPASTRPSATPALDHETLNDKTSATQVISITNDPKY